MLWLKKYWKFALALLFALAILFGLAQRQADPYLSFSTKTYRFQKTPANDKSLTQYYQETKVLGKNPATPHKVSFIAVGDIMLSRNVAQKIKDTGDPAAPFRSIGAVLQSADFSFGNLESPIVSGNGIIGGHTMVFAAASSSLEGLVKNKFKVLNLANNHALDQGLKGLESTMDYLDQTQIQHIGAGKDRSSAWQAAKVEQNGILTCFLGASYASLNDSGKTKNDFVARIEDIENLKSAVLSLKPNCDFIVVSMHAGTEYTRKPNQQQIEFAHAAIEAGADMVIGAHPHWIQTMEKYQGLPANPLCKKSSFDNPIINKDGVKYQSLDLGEGCTGKYIFYSLGNFVFDQMWSQETREGLALKISLSKPAGTDFGLQGQKTATSLDSVELLPVIIGDYSSPRPADETESKNILKKIGLENNFLN